MSSLDLISFGTVAYCPMFMSGAQVIRPYVTPSNAKSSPTLYKFYSSYGYHFGVDLVPYSNSVPSTNFDVYAPCMGLVLEISLAYADNQTDKYSVVVQYDAATTFRLSGLSNVSVSVGSSVLQTDKIGACDRWLHFEMLSANQSEKSSPSYIFNKLRVYPVDPHTYFSGNYSGLSDDFGE